MARHWTLGCDAADPHALAAFWALALDYVRARVRRPGRCLDRGPDGVGPAIGWLRVPEGKTAKNRLHIDIRVAGEGPWDLTRAADPRLGRLEAAGATYVREESYDGALGTW